MTDMTGDLLYRRRATDARLLLVGLVALGVTWWMALSDDISGLEEDVFRFFNDLPDWIEAPSWPIMQFGAIAAVPVVALVAWLVWRRWRPPTAVLAAGVVVWVLAKVVKAFVERGRPADYLTDVTLRPEWHGLGFVSGHVAVAVAMAVVLTPYATRPWRVVVWALALATSLLRIYTAAHLPLDIVGGAGLGLVAGAAVHLALGAPTGGEVPSEASAPQRRERLPR